MPPREGAAAAARSLTWLTSPSRSRDAALALAAATLWGCVLYLALGASAAPRGAVFAVFVLYVAAAALGRLCALFPPTPPLLGHLGARLRGPVARLALAPSTAEVVVVTLTTRACVGLPWGYCVVVGFLFGALSPAIVVPSLLKYDEDRKKILCGGGGGREEGSRSPPRNARRGRVTIGCPKGGDDPKGGGGGGGIGEDGLATIGVTAASVDVTYAIAGFGVAWSVIDGSTDPTTAAWKAPVALLAGVVVGVVAGVGLGALFPRGDEDEDDDEDADGSAVNGSVVTDGDGSGSVRPQNGDGSYRAAREDVDDARAFALLTTSQSILFLGSHLDATGGASVGVILASAFAARMYGDAASTRAEKPLAVIWSQARSIRRSPYDRVGAVNAAP
ncbi:uncharacterized protein MICPUCDRAFT_46463 [Micromonas pusilla CCMP1545]|uniref:Predicted protein n=1 Tax=Micromonas pusilla (strain CCMP1545) TaxID=564608 RepID=C1MJL1_MICPC|nr:uncharacterized protein MICPUCDRAFT_46463 [Micromonas pusilla CCMP1545]EEH59608.1 predicted protein [Micromonas pusilla CCMP1545]|eukprot:XP_003056232.1 predicted protein [Micromonas pusilla CCMP1545]